MARNAPRTVAIDARPRGPRGPLAEERVLGQPVLAHLVELAGEAGDGPIAVHARLEDHDAFCRLIDSHRVDFATGPPPENAAILRTDRLYDPGRLRKVLARGQDPETAVIWRLDRPSAIDAADAEIVRRRSYQPLGRFWSLAPAKAIARALVPTKIRPNAVTLASFSLMIFAAILVAIAPQIVAFQIATSVLMAAALVLDTADGHLARLQGTASEFGRWLDAVCDEAADLFVHAAIACSMFRATGGIGWIVVCWIYTSGKYVFMMAQAVAGVSEGEGASITTAPSKPSKLQKIVRMCGHADLRWHVWIVLAAIGHLELALGFYAVYFPLRTVAIGVRKAVRRG